MNGNNKSDRLALAAAALCILALLAVAAFAQSGSFRFFGPLSRVVTPNGDGRNDLAVFCFDDPADSDVSGTIYTLLGAEVATTGTRTTLSGCPAASISGQPNAVTWDGRSNGQTVSSGVYVYRITAETQSYSGSLIVVR